MEMHGAGGPRKRRLVPPKGRWTGHNFDVSAARRLGEPACGTKSGLRRVTIVVKPRGSACVRVPPPDPKRPLTVPRDPRDPCCIAGTASSGVHFSFGLDLIGLWDGVLGRLWVCFLMRAETEYQGTRHGM